MVETLESKSLDESMGRRSIDLDGFSLSLSFAAKSTRQSGSQHYMTDMLVADAENFADFGAIVVCIR